MPPASNRRYFTSCFVWLRSTCIVGPRHDLPSTHIGLLTGWLGSRCFWCMMFVNVAFYWRWLTTISVHYRRCWLYRIQSCTSFRTAVCQMNTSYCLTPITDDGYPTHSHCRAVDHNTSCCRGPPMWYTPSASLRLVDFKHVCNAHLFNLINGSTSLNF